MMMEAVEMCPFCGLESIFPNYDVKKSGFVATCHHCGEEMMLCDNCIFGKSNKHKGYTYYCCISGKDIGQSHFGMNSPQDCPKRNNKHLRKDVVKNIEYGVFAWDKRRDTKLD